MACIIIFVLAIYYLFLLSALFSFLLCIYHGCPFLSSPILHPFYTFKSLLFLQIVLSHLSFSSLLLPSQYSLSIFSSLSSIFFCRFICSPLPLSLSLISALTFLYLFPISVFSLIFSSLAFSFFSPPSL